MPTSHFRKIPAVLNILNQIPTPQSVLDIGPGFGKFGLLLREHLDVRKNRAYGPKEWQTQIDCVEIWDEYITPVHKHIYNNVIVADIRECFPSLGTYDLIIMADVVEHMEKREGLGLLNRLFGDHCNHAMVVSYPPVIGAEGKYWTNPHETHKCIWTQGDFNAFPKVQFKGAQVAYLLKEGE